ncbi:methyl-coenzyme M reductase operon protein D [Enterococcus faecium]
MEMEIFPSMILKSDTTENLLNDLNDVDNIKMVIHGQRLPPASAKHPDRREIYVKGDKIDLQVKTGQILLEIVTDDLKYGQDMDLILLNDGLPYQNARLGEQTTIIKKINRKFR